MTLRYLLDTGIVAVPVSKKPDPQILERLDENSSECAVSAPIWHELTYGCSGMPRGKPVRSGTPAGLSFPLYSPANLNAGFRVLGLDQFGSSSSF